MALIDQGGRASKPSDVMGVGVDDDAIDVSLRLGLAGCLILLAAAAVVVMLVVAFVRAWPWEVM